MYYICIQYIYMYDYACVYTPTEEKQKTPTNR